MQPPAQEDLAKNLLEAIEMDSYRLSKTTTDDITLTGEGEIEPTPPIMRGKQNSGELDELAAIINEFNRRFGIDTWTDDDKVKLFLTQQLPLDMASDAKLLHIVNNSDKQNAKISSDQRVEDLMQDVIWQYTDLYKKFTDDPDFKRQLQDYAFERLVREAGAGRGMQAKG